MNGYENAPAVALLSTCCAACGRPLLDAESVTAGMGPTCRARYGYADGPPEAREAANKLIHAIALAAHGVAAERTTKVAQALAGLRAIGFSKVADLLAESLAAVTIVEAGQSLTVRSPYSPAAAESFRALRGRYWDREAKVNVVPRTAARELLDLLKRHFPGVLAVGPKGAFVVGGA